jgi:hypothetical protein
MPFSYEPVPDEPIVIFHFSGVLTPEDHNAAYQVCGDWLAQHGGRLHRIGDYSAIELDFGKLLQIIQQLAQPMRGGFFDPDVSTYVTGSPKWTRLAVDMLKLPKFGNRAFPIFHTLDEAMVSARHHIVQERATPTPPPTTDTATNGPP